MLFLIYGLLALLPLLGIGWILAQGSITTVDGLFTALIAAAISGIFGLTAALELRAWKLAPPLAGRAGGRVGGGGGSSQARNGAYEKGKVESVLFFESHTGEPNKSIVTLSDGGSSSRMLVLEGDLRNALPVGKRVGIVSRAEGGRKVLMDVQYH
jgi:hypothetical protein